MRDLLQRNGLYLAKIEPKVDRDPEHQQVSFTFQVESGKRARFTTPGDHRRHPAVPRKRSPRPPSTRAGSAGSRPPRTTPSAGSATSASKYNKQDRLTADVTLDHVDYLPEENRVRPTIEADGGPKIKIETERRQGLQGQAGEVRSRLRRGDRQSRPAGARRRATCATTFRTSGYFDVRGGFRAPRTSATTSETSPTSITPGERHKVVKRRDPGQPLLHRRPDLASACSCSPPAFSACAMAATAKASPAATRMPSRPFTATTASATCKVTLNVASTITKGKPGDVAVTIEIEEGPQYKVSDLEIKGLDRRDRDTHHRGAGLPTRPAVQRNQRRARPRSHPRRSTRPPAIPTSRSTTRRLPGPASTR